MKVNRVKISQGCGLASLGFRVRGPNYFGWDGKVKGAEISQGCGLALLGFSVGGWIQGKGSKLVRDVATLCSDSV